MVSPDAGGVYRAKKFQEALTEKILKLKQGGEQNEVEGDPSLAMLIKHRSKPNQIERMDLVGDVAGCDCLIVDDMVDTAGTLCEAAKMMKQAGAARVFAFITHGKFIRVVALRLITLLR